MTTAMRAVAPTPREAEVVRLGVARGDGRLEDRAVSLARPVVIGPAGDLAIPGLAREHVLFTRTPGGVVLHLAEGMKGRVVVEGRAEEVAGPRELALDPRGRGKLSLGATTLLFQLSAAPPPRARPALPAAVRGGFFAQIDALFTAFVAVSFLGHFGFVVFLESADWPLTSTLERVDRVAELIFDDPVPPDLPDETRDETETDEADTDEADEADTEVADRTDETRDPSPRTPGPSTPQPMSREEASVAMSDAASTVQMLLIGASGPDGVVADALRGGTPMGNAEDVMALVAGGVELAGVRPELRERDGASGLPGTTDLTSLRRVETRRTEVEEGRALTETSPRLRTTIPDDDEIEIDGVGEFDQRVVVRMIQTRRAQITACYERAILNEPALRGRIEVAMVIEESGSVSRVRTVENGLGSDTVARCIENRIRAFRFSPGPTGGSVEFRFPFVFEQQR
jgi:hypothetical protein